jgi:hypothetical protein
MEHFFTLFLLYYKKVLILSSGLIILITLSWIWYCISEIIYNQKSFLNDSNNFSSTQLKSNSYRLNRFTLIKNLSFMKKIIVFGSVLIFVCLTIIGTILVYDSRDFFKKFFEIQKIFFDVL